MKSSDLRCPTCHRKRTRSTEANRRYWLLLHLIADKVRPYGEVYSPESFHHYFKSRFLGCEEVRLPNRKTLLIPHSTASLDVAAFSEYLTKVEAWAGERDVWLEDVAA